jgi:hypothetical protein
MKTAPPDAAASPDAAAPKDWTLTACMPRDWKRRMDDIRRKRPEVPNRAILVRQWIEAGMRAAEDAAGLVEPTAAVSSGSQ